MVGKVAAKSLYKTTCFLFLVLLLYILPTVYIFYKYYNYYIVVSAVVWFL